MPRKQPEKRIQAQNTPFSKQNMVEIINELKNIRSAVENHAAHLRGLDRKRLNGLSANNQGFVAAASNLVNENGEFLPHWLPKEKFQNDYEYYKGVREIYDLGEQISEMVWNIVMQSSDTVYTNALEFYSSVVDASKRRIEAAEPVRAVLAEYFKSRGKRDRSRPTQKEIKKDANALLRGKKDGKIILENVSPKVIKGEKKVVEEDFN